MLRHDSASGHRLILLLNHIIIAIEKIQAITKKGLVSEFDIATKL